jgi:hypothetical protein
MDSTFLRHHIAGPYTFGSGAIHFLWADPNTTIPKNAKKKNNNNNNNNKKKKKKKKEAEEEEEVA